MTWHYRLKRYTETWLLWKIKIDYYLFQMIPRDAYSTHLCEWTGAVSAGLSPFISMKARDLFLYWNEGRGNPHTDITRGGENKKRLPTQAFWTHNYLFSPILCLVLWWLRIGSNPPPPTQSFPFCILKTTLLLEFLYLHSELNAGEINLLHDSAQLLHQETLLQFSLHPTVLLASHASKPQWEWQKHFFLPSITIAKFLI